MVLLFRFEDTEGGLIINQPECASIRFELIMMDSGGIDAL
jgi:hypothetical protein